jgi:hypothetical protein
MISQTPFTSLDQLAQERARLHHVRTVHGDRLERHWSALKDHKVRGVLMRDAASDVLRSWRPAGMIAGLLGNGSLTSALGAAAFRRGGLGKRIFSFATSLLLPMLLKQAGAVSLDAIIKQVGDTLGKFGKRKNEHQEEELAEGDDRGQESGR